MDLKLIAWDHNRDDLFLRAQTCSGGHKMGGFMAFRACIAAFIE